ncbi:MAG TPA: glycoside hydrolase family 3 N-terminal domain-containing protein [Candidatus Dormibacteraeota bacterium]|jgi:beta-glucosidase|nr:glycoside hydrolase family 3 N-terminal domain-containing protein [Candidatus Dormibacteraeota bacterium]
MRIFKALLFCLALTPAALVAQEQTPPYKNPKLAIQDRVMDLLSRMTLEEKVAEITGGHHDNRGLIDPTGQLSYKTADEVFGEMYKLENKMTPRTRALAHNALQRYQMEKTRLGIPYIFFGEALHGYMAYGSTSFPQALALASTWDPALVKQVFTAAADEMASAGANQAFTPVLDLARDPRWGRTEETYGEDPYIGSRMGVAAITGLQGDAYLIDRHHVLATAKHFTAHGQPESGTNTAPANFSERELREFYLCAFEAAIREAHAGSVMASYNEIDGIPSHINHWLLDRVLRQEWGFDGYVTSDGNGLQMLYETHHVAADKADAARKSLDAGVDYDLSDGSVFRTVLDQVKDGRIPIAQLDRAVSRVLTAKFRLGLFENPYIDPDYAEKITNNAAHQALAQKAAEEEIVLLKNENNLLPLDPKKLKTIAVIGPNATDVHLGGYSRDPGRGVSILDGIRARLGSTTNVLYAEGCKITTGKQGWDGWYENDTKLAEPATQQDSIRKAVETAKKAQVAILVVGETEGSNREAWSEKHLGDRDSLDLLGAQNQLVQSVVETGVPTVVLLINGRPLSINYIAEHVPAILEGWYLGQEGGTAAARVIFGDVNPGGKLPISFPRSVGQLPDYYNHKPSRNRSYAFVSRTPLFEFGRGLSYTTFKLENLQLSSPTITSASSVKVTVDVTNTGDREGDEVPQLYIHQRVSSITRPVLALHGFQRIHLKPGEKTTVTFALFPDDLSIIGENMKRAVESGVFDILVGQSSNTALSTQLTVEAK